jgi:hypothetical protein
MKQRSFGSCQTRKETSAPVGNFVNTTIVTTPCRFDRRTEGTMKVTAFTASLLLLFAVSGSLPVEPPCVRQFEGGVL